MAQLIACDLAWYTGSMAPLSWISTSVDTEGMAVAPRVIAAPSVFAKLWGNVSRTFARFIPTRGEKSLFGVDGSWLFWPVMASQPAERRGMDVGKEGGGEEMDPGIFHPWLEGSLAARLIGDLNSTTSPPLSSGSVSQSSG